MVSKEIPEQRLEPYHDEIEDWEPSPLSDEEIEALEREFNCGNVSDETLAAIYEEVVNI